MSGSVESAVVQEAAEVLRAGGLVAFPTETVYGLGADASNAEAVRKVFAVKRRPSWHPLIVHLGDAGMLDEWAVDIPDEARVLADRFWPGPLTMILARSARVPGTVTGGQDTVGLRVPDQQVALAMLAAFGGGVAAPSANHFGRTSPTTAEDVRSELGDEVDLVLDGGPCAVGVESTIVDLSSLDSAKNPGSTPTILRPGAVTAAMLEEVLGRQALPRVGMDHPTVRAPGTLDSHYSPDARVELSNSLRVSRRASVLVAEGLRVGVLAPTSMRVPPEVHHFDPAGDAASYARCLYRRFREADSIGLDVLLVVPPEPDGVGLAVVDRINRAAG